MGGASPPGIPGSPGGTQGGAAAGTPSGGMGFMNPGPAMTRSQLKPAPLPPTCLRRSLARARRSRARWRPRGATRCRQRDPGLPSPGSRGRGRPPRQTRSGARARTPFPTRPPRGLAEERSRRPVSRHSGCRARLVTERRETKTTRSLGSAPWRRRVPLARLQDYCGPPTLIPGRKIHRHAGLSQCWLRSANPRRRSLHTCMP